MDHSKETDFYAVEEKGAVQEDSPVDVKPVPPIAPDHFDERYRTTRKEIWAYYACVCC